MPVLRCGEVELWSLAVPAASPADIDAWQCHLSAEEQARAGRFRFAADRAAYVAAHALLRALLAAYGATAPRFTLGPWGRPELAAADGLRFSLTHTRNLVAAAVAMTDDLGVDAETTDAAIDVLGLSTRFFAPAEAAMLRALPPARRADAFCRVWTLKEAFVKALGTGLSTPLDAFAFGAEADDFTCSPSLGEPEAWSFRSRMTDSGHLSVALRVPRQTGLVLHDRVLLPDDLAGVLATLPPACEARDADALSLGDTGRVGLAGTTTPWATP